MEIIILDYCLVYPPIFNARTFFKQITIYLEHLNRWNISE